MPADSAKAAEIFRQALNWAHGRPWSQLDTRVLEPLSMPLDLQETEELCAYGIKAERIHFCGVLVAFVGEVGGVRR